jgi:DNA repair protein RadC
LGQQIEATSQLVECLHRLDGGRNIEFLHAFFLNRLNQLNWSETIANGGIDEVRIDYRSLICTALRVDSSGLILAHNHPSGAATPSPKDISSTLELQRICGKIGIHVLDHIIVASGSCFSFRAERIL